MSDQTIRFNIPGDHEGFVAFECPYCNLLFKLSISEVQAEDVFELFCPYCGLQHQPSNFLTTEVKEQAMRLAANQAKSLINDFSKDIENIFKGSKNITFKPGSPLEMESDKILFDKNEELMQIVLDCCKRSAKVKMMDDKIGIYCPYCGVK
jgi:uncharacterized Zn-finger protein